jgi:hypothetical protein
MAFAAKRLARFGPSSSGAFSGNRFPQQKVFQDELPFAGNEWSTANIACYFEIDSALQLGQRKNGGGFGLGILSTLPRQTRPTQNRSWPRMTVT